jgi:hypothetical protein
MRGRKRRRVSSSSSSGTDTDDDSSSSSESSSSVCGSYSSSSTSSSSTALSDESSNESLDGKSNSSPRVPTWEAEVLSGRGRRRMAIPKRMCPCTLCKGLVMQTDARCQTHLREHGRYVQPSGVSDIIPTQGLVMIPRFMYVLGIVSLLIHKFN